MPKPLNFKAESSKGSSLVTYFAYGSNLDEAQMRARCPTARVAGPATLREHALTFGGYSGRWGGAVATVRPAPGTSVSGVLYVLDDEMLARLDELEGVPFAYERVVRAVVHALGGTVSAHVYAQPALGFVSGPPSRTYVEAIARGYRRFELDLQALHAAVADAER